MVSHELLSQPICHRGDPGTSLFDAIISHRPGQFTRFRRLPVVPPALAPPAAFATWHHQIITITEQSVSRGCMHHCGVIPGCYQPPTYG